MNNQIETFKNNLYTVINNSNLPVGVVKLIMQNTLYNINNIYEQQLTLEQSQSQETQDQSQNPSDNNE